MNYALIRLLFIGYCLLSSLSSFAQNELTGYDLGRLFFDSVRCDGRMVQMAFRCHPKFSDRCFVGYREYGRCAIDTLTAGRIVLPDSVTDDEGQRRHVWALGRQAFAHCSHVTEVVMPDDMQEIGDQAFYGCTALREVTLPLALRVIYPFAFRGCSSLSIVRVKVPTKQFGIYDNVFDQQTLDRATLIVPTGTIEQYSESLVFGMFRYRTEAFE